MRRHHFSLTIACTLLISVFLAACTASNTDSTSQGENTVVQANNPHDITGVTDIPDIGAPAPITSDPQPQLPVELVDSDGNDVTVSDVSRIVAMDLYGGYTKTLIGLGLEKNIVGRAVSSTEKELENVPVVTQNGHSINVEAVLNLNPSLIIVDHSIGPREAINQLRDTGLTVVVLEPKRSIDSIEEDITNLASIVGLPTEGAELAQRSMDSIKEAQEEVAQLKTDPPMKVAFLYARGTGGVFFILGPESGTTDLIEGAGAVDLAAENSIKDAAPANAEALAQLNPDAFIMMRSGLESAGGLDAILQRPGVAETTAGQNRRIITIEDGSSLAYGPQTGELILKLCQALYAPDQL